MEATFMTALHIHNVRHLKDIHIALSNTQRKSLILTGKNGSGKTSVLTALEAFLTFVNGKYFYPREKCWNHVSNFENQIELNADTQNEADKLTVQKQQGDLRYWKEKLDQWDSGAVAEYASYADLRRKYQAGDYILAYYGDHRKLQVEISKNIEKISLKNVYAITERPCQQLLKYLVNLKTTEAFAATSGDQARAEEIKAWFARFENVLRRIYEDESIRLHFHIEDFRFSILQANREPFDFNTMSMGYAAVFDIIGDLMMRMEHKRSYDLEGLVLIDEIETHLHVELQKKIVPILMELFPNIQFVLTTHSPFILNSTPDAVVYDLETDTLVPDGLTNLPYEGIVEGYFGADTLSEELRRNFEAYRAITRKADLTDADYAKAAELELYLDEVPDFLALNLSAEYSRLKLEFSKRG